MEDKRSNVLRKRTAKKMNPETPSNPKTADCVTAHHSPRSQWQHHADLSSLESFWNLVCAVGSIGYVCYRVLRLSPTAYKMFNDETELLFEPARGDWRIVGPVKDATNTEWTVFLWFVSRMWWWYFIHLTLSALLRRLGVPARWRLFGLGVAGVLVCGNLVGLKRVLSQFAFALAGLVTARITKRIVFVWILNFGALAILNFPEGVPYFGFSTFPYLFGAEEFVYEHYYVWIITMALTVNRTLSFCHEMTKRGFLTTTTTESTTTTIPFWRLVVDLFNYVHYFPLFLTGPLMTYDEFEVQSYGDPSISPPHLRLDLSRDSLERLLVFAFNVLRFIFWGFVTEALLYRMYFGVMLGQRDFLNDSTDLWELAGIGFASGQFFHLKYLQLYGFHSLIAHADGLTPPKQPKCISRVYLYSDMWRYFDTGLYNFIKRHLYVPLGGSRHGLLRQSCASFLIFVFIYFWHGSELYILLWCVVNFLGILSENLGRRLCNHPSYVALETRLGPRMSRRFRVAAATPLFATSIIAIFMFIGTHEDIGFIYARRFFIDGLASGGLALTLYFLYTIAQTSVSIFKSEEIAGRLN